MVRAVCVPPCGLWRVLVCKWLPCLCPTHRLTAEECSCPSASGSAKVCLDVGQEACSQVVERKGDLLFFPLEIPEYF